MIAKIIKLGELDITKQEKEAFFKALRDLINIFFAIILGFGLQQFVGTTEIPIYSHSAALIVICFSWWGYYWGIICGPKELNVFNIIINCFLILIYWLLLNKHEFGPYLYTTMYFMYFCWEYIRLDLHKHDTSSKQLQKARATNLKFTFIVAIYFLISSKISYTTYSKEIFDACVIVIISFIYRIIIHYVYKRKNIMPNQLSTTIAQLISDSKRASSLAHTPISKYNVGAAILTKNKSIYTGCNIEFGNFSNTIHAEECAISNMVSHGELNPIRIAVYTTGYELAFPCGMCLQSLFELGGNDLEVIACNDYSYEIKKIKDLLANGFKYEDN